MKIEHDRTGLVQCFFFLSGSIAVVSFPLFAPPSSQTSRHRFLPPTSPFFCAALSLSLCVRAFVCVFTTFSVLGTNQDCCWFNLWPAEQGKWFPRTRFLPEILGLRVRFNYPLPNNFARLHTEVEPDAYLWNSNPPFRFPLLFQSEPSCAIRLAPNL